MSDSASRFLFEPAGTEQRRHGRRAAWLAPLAFVMAVAGACGDASGEPQVPSTTPSSDGSIIRVPVRADGSLDTVGLPIMRFQAEDTDESGTVVYDFGHVDAGAIITRRFPFRNAGRDPLEISSATSTCGCTVPQYPEEPIASGDTASIFVRFDTRDKAGPQDKVVTLTANTYPNTIQLHLVGTVDTLR